MIANYGCLYIGNNADHLQYFSNNFKKGIYTSTLAEAIQFIDSLIENNEKSPDAIVLDIPLNKNQYADFCKYLEQNKLFSTTPLLYNENSLDAEGIDYLRENKLIDDVINIHSWGVNYAKRISFLKKIKKQPRPLKVSPVFIQGSERGNAAVVLKNSRLHDHRQGVELHPISHASQLVGNDRGANHVPEGRAAGNGHHACIAHGSGGNGLAPASGHRLGCGLGIEYAL